MKPEDERLYGMLCHVLALAGYAVPLGNIIGPLVVWLMKRNDSAFVDDQGRESLNFQITMTIAMVVSALLMVVCIGAFLLAALGVINLVFIIIAAIKSYDGLRYRYPFSLRFV